MLHNTAYNYYCVSEGGGGGEDRKVIYGNHHA